MPSVYRKTRVKGSTVSLHRHVWEIAHGPIPDGYVVHHKDHDKRNNELSNLELLTHAEHSAHHNNKHPRVKACEVCGTEYEPAPTKRARSKTCSKECAKTLMRESAKARVPKHSAEVVAEILRKVDAGEQQKALAQEFGISPTTINSWVKGRSRQG